jgi:S1-C subfamily serine protease/antitoxin component YwqK of YwqJK toxin-antitoxin module
MRAHSIFLFAFFIVLLSKGGSAQSGKTFFDRAGKYTTESSAYYYREKVDGTDNQYKGYYINGGALYFEGKITNASSTDESKNVYLEKCTWYYKNGKTKAARTFGADGKESGTSFYYYESGKLWKEMEMKNGKLIDSRYKEFNEDGQASRIFEENFDDNTNDWDLYKSDKASVMLKGGAMEVISFAKEGTSRFISMPGDAPEFALEVSVDIKKLNPNDRVGLIYGFKDWQNFNFFYITNSTFYIGFTYEGITSFKAESMYSSAITKDSPNTIKVISNGEKNIYSINGEIQYSTDRTRTFGSNIGFAMSGKSTVLIDKLIYKEIDFKANGTDVITSNNDMDVKASGSGLLFGQNGYILTNYHVIENSNKIQVELNTAGVKNTYAATVVQKDIDNDLAILKIKDDAYKPSGPLTFAFKESGSLDVGASVFTLGYPYALSGMGKEAKFTDGKVSAKTGYNGAVNSFQTSIPVQPGNSGGPVFNEKGQFVGVINSKINDADNVSYAIKLNYVNNLIELLPETVALPADQGLATFTLEEKIKVLSNYVVLIKIK